MTPTSPQCRPSADPQLERRPDGCRGQLSWRLRRPGPGDAVLTGPDRPNNVDGENGLPLGGQPVDIAVLTERLGRRLRAYVIAPVGSRLTDMSGGSLSRVLEGASGHAGAPMGIGLYKRLRDGAIFAIVAPKAGPKTDYLWQYRLEDDGTGRSACVS